jgi:hypothetical protein
MSGIWSGWPHTAISIDTQYADWSYTFHVDATLTGGAVTGAIAGSEPPQNLSLIRAGLRIVPRLAITAFSAGYDVSVVLGDGSSTFLLPPQAFTDTQYHIHKFQGKFYFARGAGTITADDGITTLAGGTLISKHDAGYSGATRLIAGFETATDNIQGYDWAAKSSSGSVASDGGALSTAGQAALTLPLTMSRGYATPTGVTLTPTDTIDGVDAGVTLTDGDVTEFVFDDVSDTWVSTPVTSTIVDSTGSATTTLPTDPTAGDTVFIVSNGGSLTVNPDAGDTIGGSSDGYVIGDGDATEFVFDGTTWVPTDVEVVIVDASGGPVTYTLPPNPADGETVVVVAIGGTVTVVGGGFGAESIATSVLSMPLTMLGATNYAPTEVNYAYLPMKLANAATAEDNSVRGTMTLRVGARGAEDDFTGAFLSLPVTAQSYATPFVYEDPVFEAYFFGTFSSYPYPQGESDITERAFAYSDVYANYVMQIKALATAIAEWKTFRTVDGELASAAIASSAQQVYLQTFMSEQGQVTTAALGIHALLVLERAVATGDYQTYYQAAVELSSSASALDAVIRSLPVEVSDAAAVADAIDALAKAFALIAETAEASSTVESLLTITVTESVRAVATDGVESLAQYLAEVLETGRATIGLRFPDGGYVAWVMNTEGALAVSEYDNFEFNSFAEMGRDILAAGETGLYRLGGDTDAGADINASVLSLMQDFGTSKQKRMRGAYLGYTTSGELILKVKAVEAGQLVEHWFRAESIPAAAPREQWVELAMGMKSRYWQFELINVDGADFEIDELELHPLVLARRV